MTRITVLLPHDLPDAQLQDLKNREADRAAILQRDRKLVHLWRVAGRMANVSIWDCSDHDELHTLLTSLPMFPYFQVEVTPLAKHPSSLA